MDEGRMERTCNREEKKYSDKGKNSQEITKRKTYKRKNIEKK